MNFFLRIFASSLYFFCTCDGALIAQLWNTKVNKPTELLEKLLSLDPKTKVGPRTLGDIVELTQKAWLRSGERWEHKDNKNNQWREKLSRILQDSTIVKEISPQLKKYDLVVVLGATGQTIRKRLEFLKKQNITYQAVVLLGSDRRLKNGPSEDEQLITETIKTESDVLRSYFEEIFPGKKFQLVSSAYRGKKRPDTIDTLKDWKKQDKNFSCYKTALFISSQPHVIRQDTVIRAVIPQSIYIETIGEGVACIDKLHLANTLDSIARALYVFNKYKAN